MISSCALELHSALSVMIGRDSSRSHALSIFGSFMSYVTLYRFQYHVPRGQRRDRGVSEAHGMLHRTIITVLVRAVG